MPSWKIIITSMHKLLCCKQRCTHELLWAAVAEWLSSWLVEQEERGSIPGLATLIFRDWLSPASKSRYGWKFAKSTLILKTTNQPTKQRVTRLYSRVTYLHTHELLSHTHELLSFATRLKLRVRVACRSWTITYTQVSIFSHMHRCA